MLFYIGSIVDYDTSGVCSMKVQVFFFQAEDGIRDLVRSRGLGDVYKRQGNGNPRTGRSIARLRWPDRWVSARQWPVTDHTKACLLYTSDAADERSSVDLGGRRLIKKKNKQ